MTTAELRIEGMTCGHCVMSVKNELSKLAGVKVVDVHIGAARVDYDESRVKQEDLASAIGAAGYVLVAVRKGETGTG